MTVAKAGATLRRRGLLAAALLALVLAGGYLAAGRGPLLESLEGQSLDWRFQQRGAVAPSDAVELVLIDDRTLAALGRWPIPRRHLAAAVQRLSDADASVIVLDLLLGGAADEQAEDLPRLPRWSGAGLSRPGGQREDGGEDRALAQAIAEAGRVVLPYAFRFEPAPAETAGPAGAVAASAFTVVQAPAAPAAPSVPLASGVVAPSDRLAAGASLGHASVLLDADGALRHEQFVVAFEGRFHPSLALETVRLHRGLRRDQLVLKLGEGFDLGARPVESDPRMRRPINHRGPAGSFATHSMIDLLSDAVPDSRLAGKIVVIGYSALGAPDVFRTPFAPALPGAEYLATVIDNLLHDRLLQRQGAVLLFDLLAVLGAVLGAAWLVLTLGPLVSTLAFGLAVVAWFGAATLALSEADLWLAVVYPSLAGVLSFVGFAVLRAFHEAGLRRDAERQRHNLTRYVPAAVASSLADSDRPFVQDRAQNAAVLFADIVGFTGLTEDLSPEASVQFLRDYHARVERCVQGRGGSINQFVGDGVLASFGSPSEGADDADRALACALDLVAEMRRWNDVRRAQGDRPVEIGIGLHYGAVLIGDLGGAWQSQFTLTGDAVNVASRLESLTRQHGAVLILSEDLLQAGAADRAASTGLTALPVTQVRGREQPLKLWALSRNQGIDQAAPAAPG